MKKWNGVDNDLVFHFNFVNYNTDTSRIILEILSQLEKIGEKGTQVTVIWHYNEWDNEIKEAGEIFSEWVNVSFELEKIKSKYY